MIKKLWEDPEYRARRIKQIREHTSSQKHKDRVAEQNRKNWKNPEYRDKRTKYTYDNIDMISQASKELWKTEEYKNKVMNSFTEERRKKTSERMKKTVNHDQMVDMAKKSASRKIELNKQNMEFAANNLNSNLKFISFVGSSQMKVKCANNHIITIDLECYRNECFECNKSILRARHPKIEQNNLSNELEIYSPKSVRIGRKEIDIFLESRRIGIEYCGHYWHSDIYYPDINKHKEKHQLCVNNDIYLITLYESEWLLNKEATLNYINSFFADKKIKGIKIDKIEVKTALSFLHKNSPIVETFDSCYGLFTTELVQVMCFLNGKVVQYVKQENIVGDLDEFIRSLSILELNLNNRFIDYHWLSDSFYLEVTTEPEFKWCKREILYEKYEDIPEKYLNSKSLGRIYDCGRSIYKLREKT